MNKTIIILALLSSLIISGCKNDVPENVTNKIEYCSGVKAASQDLDRGIIRYEVRGLTKGYSAELASQAKQKYNIEIVFSGCLGPKNIDYAQGYNDTVVKYLTDTYSSDPIPELSDQLREKYR